MSERNLIDALLLGKPYFGPALCALQGPAVRHQFLGALVEAVGKSKTCGKICILEIGTWAGASAVSWAKAIIKLGRRGGVTCVDPWQPYFDLEVDHEARYREMSEAAKENSVFQLFLHNVRAAGVSDMVGYLVGTSRDVLPTLPSEKFDIVYIDGSHIYEDVLLDIQFAKRLVRDGGIICGDDLELQRDELDEQEHGAMVKLQKDYVYSPKADRSYHPGVTEAVAVEFGEVSVWEGIWAMRKSGRHWEKIELDDKDLEIPPHILEASAPKKVERIDGTRDFNLLRAGDRFLAVAKSLEPTELLVERFGERELPPILFIGDSVEKVREKALRFERENTFPEVKLIEEIGDYNVVTAGDRFFAVAKKLGPVDLFRERLGERDLPPFILTAPDLPTLRQRIAGRISGFFSRVRG